MSEILEKNTEYCSEKVFETLDAFDNKKEKTTYYLIAAVVFYLISMFYLYKFFKL